ncbi:MAG: TerD family protein, partial [Verrucomicrobiota bacterium]
MQTLSRGQRLKWNALSSGNTLKVGLSARFRNAVTCDMACFGIDENGKLSDERYFVFYNQKTSPCGALSIEGSAQDDAERFAIDLTRLPTAIQRLVFVITIDGSAVMSEAEQAHWRLYDGDGSPVAELTFRGTDFSQEKALIAGELYYNNEWRVNAVGQGFDGGLGALLAHFGGQEATAMPTPPPAAPATLSLEKKLEQAAPRLLSLAKPLKLSLEKRNLQQLMARVGLVLDASGSMHQRYRSGSVQTVLDR